MIKLNLLFLTVTIARKPTHPAQRYADKMRIQQIRESNERKRYETFHM
ncbi:MAG TPA: hypothetical protein VFK44_07335 [Bacillales bacterium]|nr:hypothetical protein [Bacillales bacterium]